ncbi:MAG: pentapeptide repeat-containing protein [Spirulina sp. SIO3F2]|nr:pentapeptide repeat-containing protein [Spirulina sp. SIO3F2]
MKKADINQDQEHRYEPRDCNKKIAAKFCTGVLICLIGVALCSACLILLVVAVLRIPRPDPKPLLETKRCIECFMINANLREADLKEAHIYGAFMSNADL